MTIGILLDVGRCKYSYISFRFRAYTNYDLHLKIAFTHKEFATPIPDHNTGTIDGKNTMHAMATISFRDGSTCTTGNFVPRLTERMTAQSVSQVQKIDIHPYSRPLNEAQLVLKPLKKVNCVIPPLMVCSNFLWHQAWFFHHPAAVGQIGLVICSAAQLCCIDNRR